MPPLPIAVTAARFLPIITGPKSRYEFPLRRPRCGAPSHRNPLCFLDPVPFVLEKSISLGVLPRDFPDRWMGLMESSEEAESRLAGIPLHLIQAVVASEDHRFFCHPGVDPHGIARAVVFYPNGGGGSTITQQLVKRVFLSSERKISRKFIEGMLSLIVERKMSKRRILSSYLSKMYWGYGRYGIEAASLFYLGKHPCFLDIGESALLAGILPAPELLNPFADPRRGKSSQDRVLRRMVAAGFLAMEAALQIAKQPLCLCKQPDKHGNEAYYWGNFGYRFIVAIALRSDIYNPNLPSGLSKAKLYYDKEASIYT